MKSYNSYIDEAKKKINKRYSTGQGTKGDQNIRDRDDEEEGARSKTRPTAEAKKVSADDAEHATALYRDQWKDRHIADYDKQHGRSDRAKEMRADAEVDRKREYAMDPKWKHAKGSSGEVKGKKSIKGNPKEEVEEMNPLMRATIAELSKNTLGSYVKRASTDAAHAGIDLGVSSHKKGGQTRKDVDTHVGKLVKRQKGIGKAVDKLSKEEVEVDEGNWSPEGKRKGMKWKYKDTPSGQTIPSKDDKKDSKERARSATSVFRDKSGGTSGTGPRKSQGTSGRYGAHTDEPDWSRSSKKDSPHKQSRGVKIKGAKQTSDRISPRTGPKGKLPEEMVETPKKSIWDTWRPRVYTESSVAGAVALPVNQMGGTSIWDLSNGDVLRNVNAFVGSIADREYLIPENAVHQLKGFMERVGLTFPEGIQLPTGNGTISIPLQRWGGTFGKTATTPFDEFENEPENVGLDLKITVEELRNNSWKVYAKIV